MSFWPSCSVICNLFCWPVRHSPLHLVYSGLLGNQTQSYTHTRQALYESSSSPACFWIFPKTFHSIWSSLTPLPCWQIPTRTNIDFRRRPATTTVKSFGSAGEMDRLCLHFQVWWPPVPPPLLPTDRQAGLLPGGREGQGLVGKWYRCGFHANLFWLLETKLESQGAHGAGPALGFHLLHTGSWGEAKPVLQQLGKFPQPPWAPSTLSLPLTPTTSAS